MLTKYGDEFSNTLNSVYGQKTKKFRLDEVVQINDSSFIASIFKYDNRNDTLKISETDSLEAFTKMTEFTTSSNLITNRVIKLYSKNMIIYIKPNQNRYWLSLNAYRDADSSFIDLVNSGY